MKVCENPQLRPLADDHLQAPQASSDARAVGFRALLVRIDARRTPFSFFFLYTRFPGGNESGVGGDQKFDRVESTTETRAARCMSFLSTRATRP